MLAHDFRSFSLWSLSPIISGPVVRYNILAEDHGREKLVTSWQPRSRESKQRRTALKCTPPIAHSTPSNLVPSPEFPPPPSNLLNYESMD
jgi:hypothetical protein